MLLISNIMKDLGLNFFCPFLWKLYFFFVGHRVNPFGYTIGSMLVADQHDADVEKRIRSARQTNNFFYRFKNNY